MLIVSALFVSSKCLILIISVVVVVVLIFYIIGLPMPRPICGASPPALGLVIVSSTDKIEHVASPAACKAFNLITDGSHTQASKLSAICSLVISTPNHEFPKS